MNQDTKKREIFSNLEKSKRKIPIGKRFKDSYTKGLTLHKSYREDWDQIRDIFDQYSIDLSHQGPIITKQTLEEVRMAQDLTRELVKDSRIRQMAERVSYPLRNVYPNPRITEDQLIEGTIFIVVLRLIPSFCMKTGIEKLKSFINNGIKYEIFEPIFNQHGTIRETQTEFERQVLRMIEALK